MKAVLVIDEMPDSCLHCEFNDFYENAWRCTKHDDDKTADAMKEETRPSWCPLRPLPKHKYGFEDDGLSPSDQILVQNGWNDCLDDITGETE